jgi:hypothetical protein
MDQKKNAHKEKYRQTNAKHWCTYCKIFIMNNDLAKKRHENSAQHQDALKRFVGKIQKEEREKSKILKDFASKTGMVLEAAKKQPAKVQVQSSTPSFYSQPTEVKRAPVPLLSVRPPLPVPRALALSKTLAREPVGQAPTVQAEEQITDEKEEKERIMAESAIVGQWEVVAEPSVVREEIHLMRQEPISETFKVTEKIIESAVTDESQPVEFIKKTIVKRNIRR